MLPEHDFRGELSTTPLSVERYIVERLKLGSLHSICQELDSGVSQIGKDVGGIPENQPALRRCPLLCSGDFNAKQISLKGQLKLMYKAVVGHVGGLLQVPHRQPSEADLPLK